MIPIVRVTTHTASLKDISPNMLPPASDAADSQRPRILEEMNRRTIRVEES